MSSIIRRGHTFHGISVFGRGVFTNKYGWTYAGQCKDGYACGLGVLMWSERHKEYAEHGPDGQYDGRQLDRYADGGTGYRLFERRKQKEYAVVFADGRCTYNGEGCLPDDPRLLALIAHVAPVEVRPAARARHRPATRPQAIVRRISRLGLHPQALGAAMATEVQPHAARRRWWPCGTTQQQPHCTARPQFAVVVARRRKLIFPHLRCHASCTSPCTRRARRRFSEPSCVTMQLDKIMQLCRYSRFGLAGRGSRGQPATALGGARTLRPTKFGGVHVGYWRGNQRVL
jgi:hypothetical protein